MTDRMTIREYHTMQAKLVTLSHKFFEKRESLQDQHDNVAPSDLGEYANLTVICVALGTAVEAINTILAVNDPDDMIWEEEQAEFDGVLGDFIDDPDEEGTDG